MTMIKTAAAGFCTAMLFAGSAHAADAPLFAPPPQWVDVAPIPQGDNAGDRAYTILLSDQQVRFEGRGDQAYRRMVVRIDKPEGLSAFATQSRTWLPASQTLTIHTLRILRGNAVIDLHPEQDAQILRRETRLEAALLDGALTVTKQVSGLQVGDILDMAATVETIDPVRHGLSDARGGLGFDGTAGRARTRFLWPDSEPMTWRTFGGLPDPAVRKQGGVTEASIDLTQAKAEPLPPGAPGRFRRYQTVEISEFRSWGDISRLMAPYYAGTITPGSPLAAEAERIKAASADPKVRAAMALQLVQEKVRYFALAMGEGGYVPPPAETTWERRFGDCKAKTVLLLALLNALGIEAEAAIVQTGDPDGLDERLPQLTAFNHVLVRAVIGGRTYWMDGTRRREAGPLDALEPLAHRWALPVRTNGADLERVDRTPFAVAQMESHSTVDFSKGLDAPATVTLKGVARGDMALAMQTLAASMPAETLRRNLIQQMTRRIGDVAVTDFNWTTEADGSFVMTLTGESRFVWRTDPQTGVREVQWPESIISLKPFPSRAGGPLSGLPYRVNFPWHGLETVTFIAPGDGKDFKAFGPVAKETLAGGEVTCDQQAKGATFRFTCATRTLAYEVPAAEALAADPRIRALSQERVVLRQTGGMK